MSFSTFTGILLTPHLFYDILKQATTKGGEDMKKPTKNIITREYIEKELWFYNKAGIRSSILLMGILLIFCIPCTIMFISFSCAIAKNILLKIFLCIISVFLGMSFEGIVLVYLIKDLSERKKLKAGEFSIVIRKMLYKRTVYEERSELHCLYFEDFNEVATGYTYYNLSSDGDEFYLVHYNGSNKVKWVYPLSMYEYKEK